MTCRRLLALMPSPLIKKTCCSVLLAGVMSQAFADPGTIATATELKSEPQVNATTVSKLASGSSIQVGERQGAWYKVSSAQGDGWVKMLSVRLGSGARAQGASASSGLVALGAASRSNTTVATGIRGLSREDLKNAPDNQQAVAQLDQYTVSAQEANAFGISAGLPAAGAR